MSLGASRLMFVGECPSRTGDPSDPLGGRCGIRLAGMMGIDLETYRASVERMNLYQRWLGSRSDRGDVWPFMRARARAQRLHGRLSSRTVVFMGKRVADAFGLRGVDYLEWVDWFDAACILPHPSGRNRWWNDPVHRMRAERFLWELGRDLRA